MVDTNVPPKLCVRTQVMRRVHTRKLGAHVRVSSKNMFAHISYTSFCILINSG